MKLIEYNSYEDKESLLKSIEAVKDEWSALPFLLSIIKEGKYNFYFKKAKLLMLLDDENPVDKEFPLASIANFCDQDEIDCELKPWIGFVFTAKKYRGRHLMGTIIEHCMKEAVTEYPDSEYVYVSTGEKGLYEKYGFEFYQNMESRWNGTSLVYRRRIIR